MEIAFLVNNVAFGGGERILKMLIDEFCHQGHAVTIFSWNKGWLTVNNGDKYYVKVLPGLPVGIKGKVSAYMNLKRELLVVKPDCLIIFSLAIAEVGVIAAKYAHVPTILSERVDPKYLPKSKLHRILKILVFHLCNGIVFQTIDVKKYFAKSIQKKSIVIQNPVMDDELPVVNVNSIKKEIVTVGRLSDEKNHKLLISAFAELNIPGYKLRIFGDGPLLNDLTQMVASLGMEDKIVFEGSVNRVVDYIKDSDIFVLPSYHEGMPNALIEAMAMGLACISTDFSSGGARSLITDSENGLIVPVNNIVALKKAILKLIANPELKRKIKSNAIHIRQTNSKELIIPMWVGYIEKIVGV